MSLFTGYAYSVEAVLHTEVDPTPNQKSNYSIVINTSVVDSQFTLVLHIDVRSVETTIHRNVDNVDNFEDRFINVRFL